MKDRKPECMLGHMPQPSIRSPVSLEFCHEVGLTTLGQPRLSEGAQPYQPKDPS
jgi:hypothetical protein